MSKKNKKGKNKKKGYEKPAVIYSQELEGFAGTCDSDPINGKTGTGDQCTIVGN